MNRTLLVAVTASGLMASAVAYGDSEGYPPGVSRTFSSGMTLRDVGSEATPLFDRGRNETQSNFSITDVGSSAYQDWSGRLIGTPRHAIVQAGR